MFSIFSTVIISLSLGMAKADPRNIPTQGGMWMPQQISAHAELLKKMGLKIDPSQLSRTDSKVLNSIVWLEFCSGSFVSPDGLIITNHHCVEGILSYLSQIDRKKGLNVDYVTTGFLAKNIHEERAASPTQKILITQDIIDVTEEVLEDLEKISDPVARYMEIEKRTKAITKHAEEVKFTRADVVSFFRGEKYFLIKKLELKDIRLVYAPPKGVGYFGGDTDNWHWPRHTGDFALLRAYVGNDQNPKEYHINNVPYRNPNHLTVSSKGVSPYDLVFVAGYPGATNRLLTFNEVKRQISETLPEQISTYNDVIRILKDLGSSDENVRINTETTIFSLSNVTKNRENALLALDQIQFLKLKQAEEEKFLKWVSEQTDGGITSGVLAEIESTLQEYLKFNAYSLAVGRLVGMVDLMDSAFTIAKLAREKAKPDMERRPAFMERNWQRIIDHEKKQQASHSLKVTKTLFTYFIQKFAAIPSELHPKFVAQFLTNGEVNTKAVADVFEKSALLDPEKRLALFNNATEESLSTMKDPLLEIGKELAERSYEEERKAQERAGRLMLLMPNYIKAWRAFKVSQGEELAPDANSTLRLTFGQVKGYKANRGGKIYNFGPFSNVDQLMKKHRVGDGEFEVPMEVQRAIVKGDFAPFADDFYGTLPVNFLAGVDTTGGNSGSAALNDKGELVGLLFDGNEDALYSDYHYEDAGSDKDGKVISPVRSILLDIRYALWMMKELGGTHLLKEMKLNPPCEDVLGK